VNISTLDLVLFALLALTTIVGAVKVVSTRNIVHAAFWLFPTFAGIAGFYLYLGAQFLAAIQVLIYIGAILVLIIFAVTLTRNASDTDEAQSNGLVIPVALSAAVLLFALGGALMTVRTDLPKALDTLTLFPGMFVTDISAFGTVLLQQYLLPFEITSILLLSALIGAVVLAHKEKTPLEQQDEAHDACVVEDEAREPAGV
jgi:NADH:ubiquinone oxidoreductase subunit 6 (subunit J)